LEAEGHQVADGADAPAPPATAKGLRGIFHDAQPVPGGDVIETVHVHGKAGEEHRHDRSRKSRRQKVKRHHERVVQLKLLRDR